jgi:bacteriorhodopsin
MLFSNLLKINSFDSSFYITGSTLLLVFLFILIFLPFMKDQDAINILLLEIFVLAIASYFYFLFIKKIKSNHYDIKEITKYRYIDWAFTTPILLLTLTLFLNYLNKGHFFLKNYLYITFFNFCMLFTGYLGEIGQIDKYISLFIGFIFYFLLIIFIWIYFINSRHIMLEKIIFIIFSIVWGLYGVAFMLDDKTKNMMYNILDSISKGFFAFCICTFYISRIF